MATTEWERRERVGGLPAELAVDPKVAQAETIYTCGVCGATHQGDWPPCCKDGAAFAAAHPGQG